MSIGDGIGVFNAYLYINIVPKLYVIEKLNTWLQALVAAKPATGNR